MLVDATQPEETRVAVIDENNNQLQDFDFESKIIRQIKGNIYLAKVTRVEPSLQSAFLEYGGNRQAFLPFTEIHPDYFRIPIADREKLIEQEREDLKASSKDDDEDDNGDKNNNNKNNNDDEEKPSPEDIRKAKSEDVDDEVEEEIGDAKPVFRISHRNYKIQEVIKPRQIMLIQITKEERGSKGAAVTTFISLPGRYCVLMPNSNHGGGVSRKINNPGDRKKMKKILSGLNVPDGMSVILRTAGIGKTKAEIKRDLDYLLRLWNNIRELTLQSNAPELVYEEGDLIKRSIRDRFGKDIDQVVVSGKEGYKSARDFMKMLSPSKSSKIKEHKDDKKPLFQAHNVEKQIEQIYVPTAHMKSGGSIVINPTEALVAIDVNSGRSTKERHIEETALQTNLEAAEEVARQLRLRDLGGLIVIDFIDMENYKNNRQVEKKLKECLSRDRARVQVGRISNFGLLELSRQRLRPSLFETNYKPCTSCMGTGRVRTTESSALNILRAIEQQAIQKGKKEYRVKASPETALYILNQKRSILNAIEEQHKVTVFIDGDAGFVSGQYQILLDDKVVSSDVTEETDGDSNQKSSNNKNNNNNNRNSDQDDGNNKKRRRRGKRGGRRRQSKNENGDDNSNNQNDSNNKDQNSSDNNNQKKDDNKGKKRGSRKSDNKKSDDKKSDDKKSDDKGSGQAKSDQKSDSVDQKDQSDNKKLDDKPSGDKTKSRAKAKSSSGRKSSTKKDDDKTSEDKKSSGAKKSDNKKSDDKKSDDKKSDDKKSSAKKSNSDKDSKPTNDNKGDDKETQASKKKDNKSKKKGWWQRLKEGS